MLADKNILDNAARHVIVALDCSEARAYELVDMLDGLVWVKVGMELYYDAGSALVAALKARGLSVFLDLKLNDIPNTVRSAAHVLASLGVDMITVHALGGPAMVAAARAGLDEGAEASRSAAPRLLAVTVLTSMDQAQLASVGIDRPVAEEAGLLARMATDAGADGVVCSAFEAHDMRTLLGPDALVVTPGIRPAGSAVGDQARVATPERAISAGATHLVIGRPITQADDPRASFDAIIQEIACSLDNA